MSDVLDTVAKGQKVLADTVNKWIRAINESRISSVSGGLKMTKTPNGIILSLPRGNGNYQKPAETIYSVFELRLNKISDTETQLLCYCPQSVPLMIRARVFTESPDKPTEEAAPVESYPDESLQAYESDLDWLILPMSSGDIFAYESLGQVMFASAESEIANGCHYVKIGSVSDGEITQTWTGIYLINPAADAYESPTESEVASLNQNSLGFLQLRQFEDIEDAKIPEPTGTPSGEETVLDMMENFAIPVRVEEDSGRTVIKYLDRACLLKILGAKEEQIPIITEDSDDGFTLTTKKALLFHTKDLDDPKTHAFAKSLLVTSLDLEGSTLTATFEQALVGAKVPYSINPILTINGGGGISYVGGGGENYEPGNGSGWSGSGSGDGTGSTIGTPGIPSGGSCTDEFPGGGAGGGGESDFPGDNENPGNFPGKEYKCW